MTNYLLDCVNQLEDKFDILFQVVLERYIKCQKTTADVEVDIEKLPFSLKMKYKYLIEDHRDLLQEVCNIKEFFFKISSTINFMNGCDLIEYMVRKYANENQYIYMLNDIKKILSRMTLTDFAGVWVSAVPNGGVEVTLELDSHWQYKSMEDLRTFHVHYPHHKYWHFKRLLVKDDILCAVYSVPKSTRFYQYEQYSLRSHDISSVYVGRQKVLDFSEKHDFISKYPLPEIPGERFGLQLHPTIRELMVVSTDGVSVSKKGNVLYQPALVYSTQPLCELSCFEVEMSLISSHYAGKIMIGICRVPRYSHIAQLCNPTCVPYESRDYCVWHNGALWNNLHPIHMKTSYGSVHLMDLKNHDRIGFVITITGDLAFYVNGECQGLAASNVYLESCDVYAVVAMLEGCNSITVSKSGTRSYLRLVDLCIASLSKSLHVTSDLELLQLPKSLADRVHANVLYSKTISHQD